MSKQQILTPFLDDIDVILYAGDCIEVMRQMPEASVDAIVTDPPYGLEFMGRDWDGFGTPLGFQTWTESWAREALRILKPGGHLLAFAGTRTYHRMASGVEDAGFEIRDCIAWMYGSGFPKSLDVSKAIDKAAGAEREVRQYIKSATAKAANMQGNGQCQDCGKWKFSPDPCICPRDNGPQTKEGSKWDGWGTALKPAFEPIVVARKPLIGTVAANVLEHGTGALNIDACRIGTDAGWSYPNGRGGQGWHGKDSLGKNLDKPIESSAGRWPANIALDATAANILDQQSGERASSPFKATTDGAQTDRQHVSFADLEYSGRGYTDTGGASRFFYTAKASRQDRNAGGLADNTHPTVKPTELMRWLIRLVTPPGGIILDPFGGSGSTGLAARAENTRCILIEREPEYLQIIRDRLSQLNLFTENNQ
jgi:site-specific DNA-methyltransferase (adenine-specific)